ncbi:TIGR02569 family protein [Streptomyces lunaelactis]|uniref:TIGR02569 family protein n=1 Tax=Streptomyces lunaelactis TaxID=1535768 RepID=UPI0015851521|nr:TIGR02569 family protein [Streptomyces lunaelactis]NUL06406.1 TIGR02569 family protein [Streptomyces lunaelactis]
MSQSPAPPASALKAFGAAETPVPLPGGQGSAWRSGALVLKPTAMAPETTWRAGVLHHLPESSGFRVARPVPAADGSWAAYGWEAWRPIGGSTDPHRADDVIRAGEAFHAALADLPRPRFIGVRDNAWSHADRLAWEETEQAPDFPLLGPLLAARRPVSAPAQIVHGDLLGNVLFEPGHPPAIIDWPPYWRPAAWASAVVAVDALCGHGAEPELLDRWSHLPDWCQLLVRALIFRIATHETLDDATERKYRPVVDLVLNEA